MDIRRIALIGDTHMPRGTRELPERITVDLDGVALGLVHDAMGLASVADGAIAFEHPEL